MKEEHSSEVQVQDESTTSHEHTTNGEWCSSQPDLFSIIWIEITEL